MQEPDWREKATSSLAQAMARGTAKALKQGGPYSGTTAQQNVADGAREPPREQTVRETLVGQMEHFIQQYLRVREVLCKCPPGALDMPLSQARALYNLL